MVRTLYLKGSSSPAGGLGALSNKDESQRCIWREHCSSQKLTEQLRLTPHGFVSMHGLPLRSARVEPCIEMIGTPKERTPIGAWFFFTFLIFWNEIVCVCVCVHCDFRMLFKTVRPNKGSWEAFVAHIWLRCQKITPQTGEMAVACYDGNHLQWAIFPNGLHQSTLLNPCHDNSG